jgi:hypothetical protein
LIRLWREKRGEIEPEDLSGNLIVQLALATEELNMGGHKANTGHVIADIQRQLRLSTVRWMGATRNMPCPDRMLHLGDKCPWSTSH